MVSSRLTSCPLWSPSCTIYYQIRALITQRNFHHKKAQKTGSSYDWQEYRSLRNRITVTIKETKRAYYSNLIQENKNHSSKLWRAIKSAIGSAVKASQIQSNEIDGEDITDPKQISASFASFFKSIIANLRQTLPVPAVPLCSPQLLTGAQFSLSQITVDFVYKQLKALNSKKSSGLPDILVRLVKDGTEALARPLTLLMNRTISEGSLRLIGNTLSSRRFTKLARNRTHQTSGLSQYFQFSPKYLNGLSTVWSTAIYRNTGFFLLSNPAFAHSTLPPHASHM